MTTSELRTSMLRQIERFHELLVPKRRRRSTTSCCLYSPPCTSRCST